VEKHRLDDDRWCVARSAYLAYRLAATSAFLRARGALCRNDTSQAWLWFAAAAAWRWRLASWLAVAGGGRIVAGVTRVADGGEININRENHWRVTRERLLAFRWLPSAAARR
jgi:hypothetical protein